MRIVVGCPVVNRAWALPDWTNALAGQTVRPDALAFIAGPSNDSTDDEILAAGARLEVPVHLRLDDRAHSRFDNERFRTLADLRNQLRLIALDVARADVLVSLDSDILLTDPTTLERLVGLLDDGWDTASPSLILHPDPDAGAWNAGWWSSPNGSLTDPRRAWYRRSREQIRWGGVEQVDIPMAAVAISRRALERCPYAWHESGEDLGFAQSLSRHRMRSAWHTGIKATHLWDQSALEHHRERQPA